MYQINILGINIRLLFNWACLFVFILNEGNEGKVLELSIFMELRKIFGIKMRTNFGIKASLRNCGKISEWKTGKISELSQIYGSVKLI